MNNLPFFTIVTVVRNAKSDVERTIRSVMNQTFSNKEYILIDGASTDGTIEVISKYSDYINYWISEPDQGIYDAMNKGIRYAHGKYLLFLNAGDVFFDDHIIQSVYSRIGSHDFDVIYGDFVSINSNLNQEVLVRARNLSKLKYKMAFSHQAAFVKTSLLRAYPFNLEYKIVADYDQISSLYFSGYSFFQLSLCISKVNIDGVSYSNYQTILEQMKVSMRINKTGFVKFRFYLVPLLLCGLRALLGTKVTSFLRFLKWKYIPAS